MFLRIGKSINIMKQNSNDMVYNGTAMKNKQSYITKEDFNILLESAKLKDSRLYALILTLGFTGRRVSELVGQNGLRPEYIDFASDLIAFRILKKRPRRNPEDKNRPKEPIVVTIPVKKELIHFLRLYIETNNLRKGDLLFNYTRLTAWRHIKALGENCKIRTVGGQPLHPHIFRHSFAVWVTQNSEATAEDIISLKELLQHSNIDTTMQYLRFGSNRQRELVNAL